MLTNFHVHTQHMTSEFFIYVVSKTGTQWKNTHFCSNWWPSCTVNKWTQ